MFRFILFKRHGRKKATIQADHGAWQQVGEKQLTRTALLVRPAHKFTFHLARAVKITDHTRIDPAAARAAPKMVKAGIGTFDNT